MRNLRANISEFELVPSDLDFPPHKDDHYDASTTPQRRYKFWSSPITKAILVPLPLIAALAPVILLVAFSPSLSHALGANGCTPSGEFVLPYTTSIWDAKRFFSITIAFLGPGPSDCSFNAAVPQALACTGYSFTQAKVIDIAWDILVGRGGQAAVIVVAYRVFGRVVKVLMRQGEVGYDLFSAVAFDAGSASSLVTIGRHVVGATPVPRTRRAVLAYVGMALATLYIVAVPSLLAAMTGYTSFYGPVLDFKANDIYSPAPLTDCGGEIAPLWGEMPDVGYIDGYWFTPTTKKAFQLVYGTGYTSEWAEYYNRYHDVYDACPVQLDISDCKAAHQKTYLQVLAQRHEIPGPMPGIVLYPNSTTSASEYTHWACGERVFDAKDLGQRGDDVSGTIAGLCRAGNGYAWGFSFLLTFLTSILNLAFVLLMYALWLGVRRHDISSSETGEFKDAVMMVTLAQRQYGGKIGEWSSSTLQKEIVEGKAGMSFVDDRFLRRRDVRPRGEREFGDPRAGDWGGDVVVSDHR